MESCGSSAATGITPNEHKRSVRSSLFMFLDFLSSDGLVDRGMIVTAWIRGGKERDGLVPLDGCVVDSGNDH